MTRNSTPDPFVPYTKFGVFVAAPGPARVGVARGIKAIQTQDYQPARDQYHAIRTAIVSGTCANDPSVLATKLTVAVENATERRRSTYREIADAWQRYHDETGLADATVERIPARRWAESPLIRVNPTFVATEASGRRRLLALNFTLAPLSPDAAHVMLRLMQLTYGDLPGLTPIVVDMRNDAVWTPRHSYESDFDNWIFSEAVGLRSLLSRLPLSA